MRLGPHFEDFVRVVHAAYLPNTFETFLQFKLQKERHDLSPDGTFHDIIRNVAARAEKDKWLGDLVAALKLENANDPALIEVMNRIERDANDGMKPTLDPFSTFWTSRGGIVDRETSRASLKEM